MADRWQIDTQLVAFFATFGRDWHQLHVNEILSAKSRSICSDIPRRHVVHHIMRPLIRLELSRIVGCSNLKFRLHSGTGRCLLNHMS